MIRIRLHAIRTRIFLIDIFLIKTAFFYQLRNNVLPLATSQWETCPSFDMVDSSDLLSLNFPLVVLFSFFLLLLLLRLLSYDYPSRLYTFHLRTNRLCIPICVYVILSPPNRVERCKTFSSRTSQAKSTANVLKLPPGSESTCRPSCYKLNHHHPLVI